MKRCLIGLFLLIAGCTSPEPTPNIAYKIGDYECIELDAHNLSVVYVSPGLPKSILECHQNNDESFGRCIVSDSNASFVIFYEGLVPPSALVQSKICGKDQNIIPTTRCNRENYTTPPCTYTNETNDDFWFRFAMKR